MKGFLKTNLYIYLSIYLFICVRTMHATMHLCRLEGNFWELILSFYHVLPGNQTQLLGFMTSALIY